MDGPRLDATEDEVEARPGLGPQETTSQPSEVTAPGRWKAQTSQVRDKSRQHKGQLWKDSETLGNCRPRSRPEVTGLLAGLEMASRGPKELLMRMKRVF